MKKIRANQFKAYREARKLMTELNISSLPVDPFEVADLLEIEHIKYSETKELFSPEKIQNLRDKKIDAITFNLVRQEVSHLLGGG